MIHAFSIRPLAATDIPAVLDVTAAAIAADGDTYRPSTDDLQAMLERPQPAPGLQPAGDVWVAEARDSGLVAFANGRFTGGGSTRLYRTECFVRPDYRRRGVGRTLLARQMARAADIARRLNATGLPGTLLIGARVLETQADARALLEVNGFELVRYFLELGRDLTTPLPPVEVPAGITLRAWSQQRADQAILQASNEAFADHWGFLAETFPHFMHRVEARRLQPENSFIAWAGAAVAGGCLNDMGPTAAQRYGRNRGWIGILFVRRPWRLRGLGRALLAASLQHARALGHTSAGLNADADNLTGAVRLYESVGFVIGRRRVIYQRLVPVD